VIDAKSGKKVSSPKTQKEKNNSGPKRKNPSEIRKWGEASQVKKKGEEPTPKEKCQKINPGKKQQVITSAISP
jgi:hypothetical protein